MSGVPSLYCWPAYTGDQIMTVAGVCRRRQSSVTVAYAT